MADRRMISGDIWQDEFIGQLDFFGRILWIGIITSCADDQGRFLANLNIIRAKIFLYDTQITNEQILATLESFASEEKLHFYKDSKGRGIFQIVNWWKYQSPQWPQPSKYPAPKGWTDRVRYHGVGRQIVVENWNSSGGFNTPLPSALPSALGCPIEYEEEESRVEDEEGSQTPAPAENFPDDFSEAFSLYNQVTNFPAFTGTDREGLQTKLNGIVKKFGSVPAAVEWCKNAYAESLKRRTREGRFYSKNNLAWVDWAIVGEIPPEHAPAPPNGKPQDDSWKLSYSKA